MTQLIAVARSRGLSTMSGDILAANESMLGLLANLGFTVGIAPGEPGLRRATLALGRS
jgi:hypothetical protein